MHRVLIAALFSVVFSMNARSADPKLTYPQTKRVDHVDTLHGIKVADPYRWLEEDVRTSKEVADWVAEQNKVSSAFLAAIPERNKIRARITELYNFEKISAPRKVANRYYVFNKNDGLQNQDVLYKQDTLDAEPKVLLDPNTWKKDGTAALAGLDFSEDGKHLAYGIAESGSDWSHWKVLRVDTGAVLEDELKWIKFSNISWTHDGKGFFYSRYPEPKQGEKFKGVSLNQKLYYHRLGTQQADDVLVYQRPDQPTWSINAGVTDDGRYLVISLSDGTTSRKARILYKDLSEPYGMPVELIDQADAVYSFIDNDGSLFFFRTDLDAPRGRVVAVDIRKPARNEWKVVIPQGESALSGVGMVGNMFVCSYLKDARTQVKLYSPEGKFVRDVDLPGIGTAGGFGGKRSETETFYSFASFTTPPQIFRYDLITGTSELWRQAKVKFNPDDYEVKQVFFASKDGTKVPMFISHKKGLKLDGNNPTLLYAYGGFNISQTPTFSVSRLAWMEMGGVFALANIRGGGEYGKEWHRAACKLNRQKAFDDFIAAAEHLIATKYTKPAKLAIQGGSNGGLLVGAVMAQRPDLYGACIPAVGVMDMLRFHKFTAGRYWVDDFGSPDDPEEFKAIYAYSPLHNLKPGVKYPATLVTTADTDDRVVPMHSFKYISQLQYCQSGSAPVLARIETSAGHGAGKPTTKIIEEVSDVWAFLVKNLEVGK